MLLRVLILNALKRWEAATFIGQGALEQYPKLADLYLATAYAARRFRSIDHPKAVLLAGEPLLKEQASRHDREVLACWRIHENKRKLRVAEEFKLLVSLQLGKPVPVPEFRSRAGIVTRELGIGTQARRRSDVTWLRRAICNTEIGFTLENGRDMAEARFRRVE